MTLINSSNKAAFKEWMREYRKMFGPDPIIRDYMGLISKFLTSSQSGVTSDPSKPVNIVMWETFDETVDLTGSLILGEYYYFPALPNDQVKVKNGSTTVTLDFDNDGKVRNKNLGDYFDIGDKRITLRGIGGTLGQAGQGVTYAISPSATTVNEGVTITFTITTTNIANGTTVYWDTTGGVNAADFSDNAVSGNINVNNNTATFTRTLVNDLSLNQTEGTETFQIRVSDGTNIVATSPAITVNDTSYAGYTLTTSSTTPAEATTVTITLATANVPNGTTIYMRAVKNDGSEDYFDNADIGDRYQSVSVQNNSATWNIPITQDFINDAGEQFKVIAKTGGWWLPNPTVATSPVMTIQNQAFTIAAVPDKANPTEGETVTFSVSTTGIPDGTRLYYNINGVTVDAANVSSGTQDVHRWPNYFDVNNNASTFTLPIQQDFVVESDETFTAEILPQGSSTVIATSSTVTIDDLPYTVSITPNKTVITEGTAGRSPVVETITFSIATSGVPDGTKIKLFPVYVTGNATAGSTSAYTLIKDWRPDGTGYTEAYQPTSYDLTVNNNAATKTFIIASDAVTEGTEVFKMEVRNNTLSSGSIVLGTSPNITITDSSYIGSRKTDKTFGPIRVMRDYGNASDVSDWYTICGLDKLPNNSKVAIFIDRSGSMTMATVQASYDLLMSKLQARNMDVIVKTNSQEDWISPFIGILDD